jgi:DNA-binding MarR family transcriptional regulator
MPQSEVLVTIITGVFISIMSGLVLALVRRGWVNREKNERMEKEMQEKIREIQKSIWRIEKTVLIMAKILDEQIDKEHPELMSNLEDIAKELLSGSNKS